MTPVLLPGTHGLLLSQSSCSALDSSEPPEQGSLLAQGGCGNMVRGCHKEPANKAQWQRQGISGRLGCTLKHTTTTQHGRMATRSHCVGAKLRALAHGVRGHPVGPWARCPMHPWSQCNCKSLGWNSGHLLGRRNLSSSGPESVVTMKGHSQAHCYGHP